jgi:hypothetical protein
LSSSDDSVLEGLPRARVEAFVREGLGCACPQEVFRRIRLEARGDLREITVGDRLLVVVWAPGDDCGPAALAQLAREARDARDARGLNRLRLVVAGEGLPARELERAFAAACGADERAHLHLVPTSAVAGVPEVA